MTLRELAFPIVVPFAIACVLPLVLARSNLARRLADVPNARSLHAVATPRVGGLGIMAGALPFVALAGAHLEWLAACAAFLAGVSFMDDMRALPVRVRLAAHALAALAVVLAWPPQHAPAYAIGALVMLAIAWMTNLFNFMDGADGLAGGMAALGFGTLAIAAHDASAPLAAACTAIAAAAFGFLTLNRPTARVFMGDAGSIPLGFLAAAIGWIGVVEAAWPAWFPLLAFSPFIADASVTLARRAWRRERIWQAHRDHYYQRLVLHGWSKRRLFVWSLLVMLVADAGALAGLRQGGMWPYAIIACWTAILAALFIAIDRRAPSSGAQ